MDWYEWRDVDAAPKWLRDLCNEYGHDAIGYQNYTPEAARAALERMRREDQEDWLEAISAGY